ASRIFLIQAEALRLAVTRTGSVAAFKAQSLAATPGRDIPVDLLQPRLTCLLPQRAKPSCFGGGWLVITATLLQVGASIRSESWIASRHRPRRLHLRQRRQ